MTSKDDVDQPLTPITVDFRLMAVRYELYVVEEFHSSIEAQIESLNDIAIQKMRADFDGVIEDDYELEVAVQQLTYDDRRLMPRLVRHPFLVMLYAVYEATVREIAELVRGKQSRALKLDNISGSFLERAKKYYKHVIGMKLTQDNASWVKVNLLADLRHVIVHTNGRMDMVSTERKEKLLSAGVQIVDNPPVMIVLPDLLHDIFAAVKGDLDGLVSRYLEWDHNEGG